LKDQILDHLVHVKVAVVVTDQLKENLLIYNLDLNELDLMKVLKTENRNLILLVKQSLVMNCFFKKRKKKNGLNVETLLQPIRKILKREEVSELRLLLKLKRSLSLLKLQIFTQCSRKRTKFF